MRKRGLNDSEVLHKAYPAIPLFSHPRDIRLIRPIRGQTRPPCLCALKSPPPTAHCLLPTAYCLLPTVPRFPPPVISSHGEAAARC